MAFELRETTHHIQQELFKALKRNSNIAILTVKTGGGKTYGAIHTAAKINPKATLLVLSVKKVIKANQWRTSVEDYNNVMNTNLTILALNYEKITIERYQAHIQRLIKESQKMNRPIILILDEIHKMKLSSDGKIGKRADTIIKLSLSSDITTTLGLSATSMSNSYIDLCTYLIMARYYTSKSHYFRMHVKEFDEYHSPKVRDQDGKLNRNMFKDPDTIDYLFSQISVFIDTSQYKPTLYKRDYSINLSPDDRQKYNQLLRDFRDGYYEFHAQLRSDQEKLISTKLAARKDTVLLGILEQRERGDFDNKVTPILIFYQYSVVFHHLKNLLSLVYRDYDILGVNGFTTLTDEQMTNPTNPDTIYLIQYEAGGEGLDWQWSNLTIFYEGPVKNEKYIQANGRNLRNVSIMPNVYHFDLELCNTIDQSRWFTKRDKTSFTSDINSKILQQELNQL